MNRCPECGSKECCGGGMYPEIERLEDMLFAAGRMEQPPCFVCGYDGPDYYKPDKHSCAARHHKLRA